MMLHRPNVTQDGGESEAQAVLLVGQAYASPLVESNVELTFPSGATVGQMGVVFGYKSAGDYWLNVADIAAQQRRVYHVVGGTRTLVQSVAITVTANSPLYLQRFGERRRINLGTVSDGFPSGRVGLYSNINNARFNYLATYASTDDGRTAGRWINPGIGYISSGSMLLPSSYQSGLDPMLLKGVRAGRFEATFQIVQRHITANPTSAVRLVLNATDADDYDMWNRQTKVTKGCRMER